MRSLELDSMLIYVNNFFFRSKVIMLGLHTISGLYYLTYHGVYTEVTRGVSTAFFPNAKIYRDVCT